MSQLSLSTREIILFADQIEGMRKALKNAHSSQKS